SFRKIPSTGGQSIEIANGWTWETHHGAQFDPDGERVVYSPMKNSAPTDTYVRDIQTGREAKLAFALQNPKWSSDGKRIVGNTRMQGRRDGDIYICPPGPGSCDKLAVGYQ